MHASNDRKQRRMSQQGDKVEIIFTREKGVVTRFLDFTWLIYISILFIFSSVGKKAMCTKALFDLYVGFSLNRVQRSGYEQ